jgi:hypothetical protein
VNEIAQITGTVTHEPYVCGRQQVTDAVVMGDDHVESVNELQKQGWENDCEMISGDCDGGTCLVCSVFLPTRVGVEVENAISRGPADAVNSSEPVEGISILNCLPRLEHPNLNPELCLSPYH